jgi:hypothetical protein
LATTPIRSSKGRGHADHEQHLTRVRPTIDEVGERLAALAAAACAPEARLARSDWTVRQATAHLVTVVPRYADGPEGRGTWVADRQQLAALNQAQLPALGTPASWAGVRLSALAAGEGCHMVHGYGVN